MGDLSWLAQEAKSIHAIFESMFYGLATVLVLIGVVSDYFKLPIGGISFTPQLIGRVLIAAILLHSYPEITNALSDVTEALSAKIGDYNNFNLVTTRMKDKLGEMTWSWTAVKDSIIMIFSFLTFFLLYISVFITNAGVIYVWTILYVFSPILIALFILPSTAGATSALYRSLIEVCAWKIVWATLAALLWSSALSEMNKTDINFLTVISFNLILAISLLVTPLIVSFLFSKGLSSMASSSLGMAATAAAFSPGLLAKKGVTKVASKGGNAAMGGLSAAKNGFSSFREKPVIRHSSSPNQKTNPTPSRTLTPPKK